MTENEENALMVFGRCQLGPPGTFRQFLSEIVSFVGYLLTLTKLQLPY